MYSFLVTLSLAIVFANALSTEEHVRSFFRPEHRDLLPEVKSLQLQDEPALKVPQHDDSTKCLAQCEPQCGNVKVEPYLTVNIHIWHCFTSGPKFVILKVRPSPHLRMNHDMQIRHAKTRRWTNISFFFLVRILQTSINLKTSQSIAC